MRTTRGKPTLEQILLGDRTLAERLAEALAHEQPVERGTHGFHTWPAGLHPDAARDLLRVFAPRSVLDPFCGGGTVLVEARIAGCAAYGTDLSPVAVRVARARAATPDEDALRVLRSTARKLADAGKAAARSGRMPEPRLLNVVSEWYAPHVLRELEALRAGIADAKNPLLEAVFSSLLVKVSWRASDTSARREKHHRPAGTTSILFHKKARELARRQTELKTLVPPGTPDAEIRRFDARQVRTPGRVDLVLTSPPYPGTYDYVPLQHLRRAWFGEWEGEDEEIGSRRSWRDGAASAQRRWSEDTAAWTKAVAGTLEPGGHLVVVIGDGQTPAGPIEASEVSDSAARAAGLAPLARASLLRPDHARDDTRWEHVLAYQKP